MRIRNDVVVSKNKSSQNKPWIVRWWGKFDLDKEAQKRYSKSFTTKKQAEKFVEKVKIDIEEGIDIENYNLTLEQLCNKYINAYKATLKYSSYISYESTVKRLKKYFTSSRHIKHIRKEDAQSFINNLKLETTGGKASDST
jgi:hypothetical protein